VYKSEDNLGPALGLIWDEPHTTLSSYLYGLTIVRDIVICLPIRLQFKQGYHSIEQFHFGPLLALAFTATNYGDFIHRLRKQLKKLKKDKVLAACRLRLQEAATGQLPRPATM
jgi:hypothetical protein